MLVVDLDNLKKVNDQQGHAAGDAHLRAASNILREAASPSAVVEHIGGDEFAALLADGIGFPSWSTPSTPCWRGVHQSPGGPSRSPWGWPSSNPARPWTAFRGVVMRQCMPSSAAAGPQRFNFR